MATKLVKMAKICSFVLQVAIQLLFLVSGSNGPSGFQKPVFHNHNPLDLLNPFTFLSWAE